MSHDLQVEIWLVRAVWCRLKLRVCNFQVFGFILGTQCPNQAWHNNITYNKSHLFYVKLCICVQHVTNKERFVVISISISIALDWLASHSETLPAKTVYKNAPQLYIKRQKWVTFTQSVWTNQLLAAGILLSWHGVPQCKNEKCAHNVPKCKLLLRFSVNIEYN